MSSAFPSRLPGGSENERDLRTVLGYPVRAVGFWTAVLLPFVLLGLIAAGVAQQSPLLFTGLVTANVTALVVGRDYKQ
jgi:hypothetical protein